ncbi:MULTISPECIES: DUF4230 domain-containing protein [unclassified Aureispira]|uniref:DUF4230 domain-containing protein n=1 Tax=unclassified Aureispira TaxID=2649989 RepID=UPI000695D065|nr:MULTISPECIES: DUF4230 domain-containing protein [unclassified Aureispira]WMX14354.1 DUF4230 domain-containing protein [Aureispira sp. CCB-E]
MKLIDSFGFFLFGALVGAFLYANYFGAPKKVKDPMPDINQHILLERVKKVAKLITVEGEFSNIHQYNDSYWSDISILRKKAIIKVNARVSVGYDLKKAQFEVDAENKVLRVKNLPAPEILSIDHDLKYYDIQEGMFNSFTEEELTSIGAVAKRKLQKEAAQGPLMDQARAEGIESLEIIKLLVEQAGWRFEVQNDVVAPSPREEKKLPDSIHIALPIQNGTDSIKN